MSDRKRAAFTLLELLVATAITAVMVVLLASIVGSTTGAWKRGAGQAETFAGARGALSLIGRELQGAVIDLDLGYAIEEDSGNPNNFILKFLSRRQPSGKVDSTGEKDTSAIEKVAYQLAWATRDLVPEVQESYDSDHPLPVLIRTCNFRPVKGLNEIFDVKTSSADDWAKNWGKLDGKSVKTGVEDPTTGDITEVVAENVLGWRVNPVYWDISGSAKAGTLIIDDATASNSRYYDDYITSDLKYVKKNTSKSLSNIPSSEAPRAIAIHMATISSDVLPRMLSGTNASNWGNVRKNSDLFDPSKFSSSGFDKLLAQNIRYFDATFYLFSRTP